ncbi:MAG TPA: GNAT family N-acetyltransferase [Gemmatimonadaceae bacterium]
MPLTDVTIKFLEMTAPGDLRPKRASIPGVTVARVPHPMPELNRFFYAAVGADYHWTDRLSWSLPKWREYLAQPDVDTYVLAVDGIPAGYFELKRHKNSDVEIKYFGLIGSYIGKGLGAHMLTAAAETAWAAGAKRVILDTCSLDHPKAFEHYVARGFKLYRTDVVKKEIPNL